MIQIAVEDLRYTVNNEELLPILVRFGVLRMLPTVIYKSLNHAEYMTALKMISL